ncbi:MAG: citrate transporter [Oscillospiraceae bacterium]|nr:citrate transporter [Oscillospiraceae bacterium]
MVKFVKSQPVLVIAFLAALITVFIVPPDMEYLGYCNVTVLIQLFGLMVAVAGLRGAGIFDLVTEKMMKRAGNVRLLGLVLVLICFFSSMLVTNDVALITFVPLTILIFRDIRDEKSRILVIVLETAAANLGSMLTPVGNPQNLFLYDEFGLTMGTFLQVMLPVGVVSLVCLAGLVFLLPKRECAAPAASETVIPKVRMTAFLLLFLLCLLSVFRVVPDYVCLIGAVLAAAVFDRSLFVKVDYALLATFVCFFVFVGNIARIEAVRGFFSEILGGRELFVSVALSQVISNVPAAVMLSGFTENGTELLLGVNLGGLGTIIASLASLISFQFYRKSEGARSGRYLLTFTLVSVVMLAVLIGFVMVWRLVFP